MSFILDALRKSESERQRSAVPGIAHAPLAVPRQSLPGWALAVMALLGASVVAMAGAWWLGRPEAPAPDATFAEAPAAGPPPQARAPAPQPAPSQPAATRPAPAPVSSPLRTAAAAARPTPRPGPTEEPASPPPVRIIEGPLPSAAELEARGVALPDLNLELHAYSESNRYVFINGKMYREGDTLREGPEVVAIQPRGVVLRHDGTDFLLTQQ
ncbi:MAG TPA: general secretion pathway protein GspB [Gammaproteobacteria bacterium]